VFRKLRGVVREERPDAIVLIDNEGFNATFCRSLRSETAPLIFYFAPQVWLWAPWRARGIAKRASLILAVFPAEAGAYEQAGARVEWVGHPLLDVLPPHEDAEEAFRRAGLDPDPSRPTVALMPGSRLHELRRILPIMLGAAEQVSRRYPETQWVLPLSSELWRPMIEAEMARNGWTHRIAILPGEAYSILGACRAAMVKSGTATLEMALMGVPMAVVYRAAALSYGLARCMVKTRLVAMPNILLGEKVVAELLQRNASADRLAAETLRLLEDEPYAKAIRERFQELRTILGAEGAAGRAADRILEEAERSKRNAAP